MFKQLCGPIRHTNLAGIILEVDTPFEPWELRFSLRVFDYRETVHEISLVLWFLRWELILTAVLRYAMPATVQRERSFQNTRSRR